MQCTSTFCGAMVPALALLLAATPAAGYAPRRAPRLRAVARALEPPTGGGGDDLTNPMARLMDLADGLGLDGEPFAASEPPPADFDIDPRVSPMAYEASTARVGVMVVDHGSKREAANERLITLCTAYAESHAKPDWVVAPAHMELASPSIEEAFDALVAQGCDLVVCHPFFLSPGRHATEDVPELLEAAKAKHPGVRAVMTPITGAAPGLLDLVDATVRDAVAAAGAPAPEAAFEDSFFGSIAAAIAEDQKAA